MQQQREYMLVPKKEIYHFRKRIYDLLRQGISHTLVSVVAGPGFGKTEEIESFCQNMTEIGLASILKLSLRNMDNNPKYFYENLISSLQRSYPMHEYTTMSSVEDCSIDYMIAIEQLFLKMIVHLKINKKHIFILDNFELLTNPEIKELIQKLVSAFQIYNVCWITVSDAKHNIEFSALKTRGGVFEITQNHLQFTAEELREYFESDGHSISTEQVDKLMEETDGWPLAVNFSNKMLHMDENYNLNTFYNYKNEIFSQKYFDNYDSEVRQLLLQLSIFERFSFKSLNELSIRLKLNVDVIVNIIDCHPFIKFSATSQDYRLHSVYRSFLLEKQWNMSTEERNHIINNVGLILLGEGNFYKSVECYYKSGNLSGLLSSMSQLTLHYLNPEELNHIEEVLEDIPADFTAQHPCLLFYRAYAGFLKNKVDDSLRLLLELEKNLGDDMALTVETYLLHATLSVIRNEDSFPYYYEKAAAIFPDNMELRPDIKYLFISNSRLFPIENKPHELERVSAMIEGCIPNIEKIQPGFGFAFAYFYKLEMAFCRYDLALAQKMAHKCLYISIENNLCHSILHCRWKLIEMALLSGNLKEAQKQRDLIVELSDKWSDPVFQHINSQVLICIQIALGEFDAVPDSFAKSCSFDHSKLPVFLNLDGLTYAYYLNATGQYPELAGHLDWYEAQYKQNGSWLKLLRIKIIRAIAYMKFGEKDNAIKEFWECYNISKIHQVVTPYISFNKDMRTLTALAMRDSKDYEFDQEWLAYLNKKSSTYAKKLASMRNGSSNTSSRPEGLTKREKSVLQGLSQGLTRTEIAIMCDVSPGTIKTIIKQIYNKLDAVNNAAAVRIAYETGIFKLGSSDTADISSAD